MQKKIKIIIYSQSIDIACSYISKITNSLKPSFLPKASLFRTTQRNVRIKFSNSVQKDITHFKILRNELIFTIRENRTICNSFAFINQMNNLRFVLC